MIGGDPEGAAGQLSHALEMLARVDALAAQGRSRFDADEATRHQLRYLWIVVGSMLKNYCETLGIERGASVFSPVIGFRHVLAYHAAGQIDDDLVWRFSTTRVAALRDVIIQAQRSLT